MHPTPPPPPLPHHHASRPRVGGMERLVTIFLTMLLTSIFWVTAALVGYFSGFLTVGYDADDVPFECSVESPETVQLGEEFTVRLTIKNPHDSARTFQSLDMYENFLEGFRVLSIDPKPDSTMEMSDDYGDFTSYYFSSPTHRLKEGEELQVTFQLRATEAGVWDGDLDCCTHWGAYTTSILNITVTEEEVTKAP